MTVQVVSPFARSVSAASRPILAASAIPVSAEPLSVAPRNRTRALLTAGTLALCGLTSAGVASAQQSTAPVASAPISDAQQKSMLDLGQERSTDSQDSWWVRHNYSEWSHDAIAQSQKFTATAARLDKQGADLETRYANKPSGAYQDPQGTVTIKNSFWTGTRSVTLMSTDTSLQVERQGDNRTVRQRINTRSTEYQETPTQRRVSDGKDTATLFLQDGSGHHQGDFLIEYGWQDSSVDRMQMKTHEKPTILVHNLSISKDLIMTTEGCPEFCVQKRTKHERVETPSDRPGVAMRYTWDQDDHGAGTDSWVKQFIEVHPDGSSHERYEHYPTLQNRVWQDPPVRVIDEPAKPAQ